MREEKRLRWLLAAAPVLFVALSPSVAFAHGDLQGTDPAKGARIEKPPNAVEIVFTEAPTNDSRFQVIDGCGRDVFTQASGQRDARRLLVDGGQPGRWQVTYRVISAEDGHFTRGEFSFEVAGKRDCSRDEVGTPGPRETSVEGEGPVAIGDDASFPVGMILLAGGGVILLALIARFFSSR